MAQSSADRRAAVTSFVTTKAENRPFRCAYNPSTALLVVDVQNDFADPEGSLYVGGGEDIPAIVNSEIAAATGAGGLVAYTQDWHPPTTPHFKKDGGVWPVHCVAGTWGSQLHPDLAVLGPQVRKGTGGEDGYSGFTVQDPRTGERQATGLEDVLRERGIRSVVIVGLATDYCVKETARDAVAKGFVTVVARHAIRSVDLTAGDGDLAIAEMSRAGVEIV